MIGYVKIFKPELKVADYEAYRAVYCSLCRQMGKKYGLFAHFALSYDFTFLAIMRMAARGVCPAFKRARCVFNPLAKCGGVQGGGEELEYSADAAMIMSYYKLRDNFSDRGFAAKIKSAAVYPLFALAYRKARRREDLDAHVREYIAAQTRLESEGCTGIDEAAEPTAILLSRIFEDTDVSERDKRVLSRIGYCVGKWIYITDAADDLESDVKRGNYNVLARKYGIQEPNAEKIKSARESAVPLLNICRAEAASAARLISTGRYTGIIENILSPGLENVQSLVISGSKDRKDAAFAE